MVVLVNRGACRGIRPVHLFCERLGRRFRMTHISSLGAGPPPNTTRRPSGETVRSLRFGMLIASGRAAPPFEGIALKRDVRDPGSHDATMTLAPSRVHAHELGIGSL